MSGAVGQDTGGLQPVRLRPVTEFSIGTTAFFRNRPLLHALLGRMAELSVKRISVLVHACSIGAEVWSLLIAAKRDPRLRDVVLEVYATDRESGFVAFAEQGIYPKQVLEGMCEEERAYFLPCDEQNVRVVDSLRQSVRFLTAASIESFESDCTFDLVMLMNVLLYLPGEKQSIVFDRIARYNRHLLVTTGFHFDRIKSDMTRNSYRPVVEAMEIIHDGWSDRRRETRGDNEMIPGKIFHPWSLQPFQKIKDYEYKYCAIFERVSQGNPHVDP